MNLDEWPASTSARSTSTFRVLDEEDVLSALTAAARDDVAWWIGRLDDDFNFGLNDYADLAVEIRIGRMRLETRVH